MKKQFAMLALSLAMAAPALAEDTSVNAQHLPQLTVTGEGKVYARPDQAQVESGVTTQAPTAAEALAANNTAMAALIATVKAQGIEERDVMTSGFNVNPQYREANASIPNPRRPQIVGYEVTNTVHIRVRDIHKLGALLDALVKSGSNNINNVSFSIAQPERLLDNARVQAVADAKRKAELYAGAAGVKLGRILFINESGAEPPHPMMFGVARAASVPIAVGETELNSSVTVVYAIGE